MGKKLILKASAGTGKTYRLSLEYIGSLIQGIDFRDILVMTFTRKATSEIKERILSFLYQMCFEQDFKEEIERNLKNIYGEQFIINYAKLKDIYSDIIENKDKLKIYTIDAFTNMLFKNIVAPYLKIYKYEIIDDDGNKEILTKTFQKLFENKEAFNIFRDFLEDNSERDMRKYITMIEKLINERWKFIVIEEGNKTYNKSFEYSDLDGLIEEFKNIVNIISDIKGYEPEQMFKKDFKDFWNTSEKKEYIYEKYDSFLKNTPWNGNKIKNSKKADITVEVDNLTNIYSKLLENLAKDLFNTKVIPYENNILKTIETIYRVYDEIKMREKKFTYTDISNYTFKYLYNKDLGFIDDDGNLTNEFFEVIDGNIRSIFIDEFQDTSILQWKILKNIIDKSENIICVGDEKQSIYGWRGGEKRLFENLDIIIDADVEILNTCYRSSENIIKYVNDLFIDISQNTGNESSSNWTYIPVKYIEKEDKGFITTIIGNEEKSALDIMIENITTYYHNNYNGIGIISRTKKHLNMIAEKLSEHDIPYTLESQANLVDLPSIKPLYNIIRWLVKGDYLALLDSLRSDLLCISTELLKFLIDNKEKFQEWLEDSYINEKFDDVNQLKIIKELQNIYKNTNGETRTLAYKLIISLGTTSKFNTQDDKKDIYTFYKLLKTYKYFNEFIIDLEDNENDTKFQKISGTNEGITLLTIHKSKGLEFDSVFYFIPKSKRHSNYKGMEVYFKTDKNYREVTDFLVCHGKFDCVLENIPEITYLKEEKEKQQLEEINNLYVALTRPKKNLFVVIEDSKTLEDESLSKLKSHTVGSLNIKDLADKKIENNIDVLSINLQENEKHYKIPIEENYLHGLEKIGLCNLDIEKKRVAGNIVHFFLENLREWTKENIEFSKKITFSRFTSIVGIKELNRIFSYENLEKLENRCKILYSNEWDYVHNEYVVYYKESEEAESQIFRLDRLMIKKPINNVKGKILIIDYKTGSHNKEQSEVYVKAVKQMLKNYKVDEKYDILFEYIELNI
ncbi:UvrD-helicase domain-containing protein [Fusobacterium hominis]|uniref:DNA 3'-5' helicase n=2 Tax=Fusobacterium TaxID=848 RepID=A0A7G9GY43_9FUSO|nr:UvrD-helicase domain-containing protein [Fusobacterium hominis]QNM15725.1 UvrD-helicase domain-containing protein [Fusobacterium hominis]